MEAQNQPTLRDLDLQPEGMIAFVWVPSKNKRDENWVNTLFAT